MFEKPIRTEAVHLGALPQVGAVFTGSEALRSGPGGFGMAAMRPASIAHRRAFRILTAAAIFAIALAWFSAGVERSGIASVFCDPVSRIAAQDEAVYSREVIEMVTGGRWLTPTYLGRYVLNKPPLLQWMGAVSAQVFGISAWAIRLPSLVAASFVAVLVFLAVWRVHSFAAALAAFLLIAPSHLFYVFARFFMTDMLLTLWVTAALFVLMRDPGLRSLPAALGFGAFAGAAIMTKGAAGCLPWLALAISLALAPRNVWPRPARIAAALAATAVVALPWHIYQLAQHPRWFVADYILTQHLSVGLAAPPQYSTENHLVFYLRRLFLTDPVLAIAGAGSLTFVLFRSWRRRPALIAWICAMLAALAGFRYRSAYYLLPLLPALAIVSAEPLARLSRGGRVAVLAILLACASVKLVSGSPVWGLPAGQASQRSIAPALERYCGARRSTDLILIDANDEFYASDLPLYRLRYCLRTSLSPSPNARRAALDYEWLGIDVSVEQFEHLRDWLPIFRERLAGYDLSSGAPVATVIWARSDAEVARLIESNPGADFLLPRALLLRLDVPLVHDLIPADSDNAFLLSRAAGTHTLTRACRL